MEISLGRIIIYSKKMENMAAFYEKFFEFNCRILPGDRIVELNPTNGGAVILLHPAAKSVKTGQVTLKLVFDVKDVERFKNESLKKGLKFGTTHYGKGYSFSNAKDPDKNNIQISSRRFAVK